MSRMLSVIGLVLIAVLVFPALALAQETTHVSESGSLLDQLLNMSPIAVYMLVCGVTLPFVIAAINRCHWASFAKLVTTVVVCIAASFGWFLYHGDIVPVGKWLRLTLMIFAGATLFYQWTKPAVKEVEAKTG